MTLRPLNVSIRAAWGAHDAWSETYIGLRRLVYDILPERIADQAAEDAALCQLALVGANHLVELALDRVLKPFAEAGVNGLTPDLLQAARQHRMLTHWVPIVTEKSFEEKVPAVASMEALSQRRNATVHRESALATVVMARSALFTAAEGSRFLFVHADSPFPWEDSLRLHPIASDRWFADLPPLDA